MNFTVCVNRERLAFSEGDFQAAQKIMQLLGFETTPDMGMTG